jgi:hypothetical protein
VRKELRFVGNDQRTSGVQDILRARAGSERVLCLLELFHLSWVSVRENLHELIVNWEEFVLRQIKDKLSLAVASYFDIPTCPTARMIFIYDTRSSCLGVEAFLTRLD